MNFKTTIVLVMLAVIVGVFFYFQLGRSSPRYNAASPKGPGGEALFAPGTLTTSHVKRIEVTRGDKTVVMTRRGKKWRQTRPVTFGVRSAAAGKLIDDAARLRAQETFTPGQDKAPTLAQARLDPPRAVIQYVTDRGKTHRIKLGRLISGEAYVQIDDAKQVRVVPDTLSKAVFDHGIEDWRVKTLDVPKAGAIDKLTITAAGRPVSVVKSHGRWFLDKHSLQRADADAVRGLIAAAGNLRVKGFIENGAKDPARYGLDKPRLTMTLTHAAGGQAKSAPAGPGQPQGSSAAAGQGAGGGKSSNPKKGEPEAGVRMRRGVFRVGEPANLKGDAYFATWSPTGGKAGVVFIVAKPSVDALRSSPDDLRDPRVTIVKPTEVATLDLRRKGMEDLALTYGKDGYAFVQPGPGFKAGYDASADFIKSLTGLEASGYLHDFKPKGDPAADLSITLRDTDRAEHVAFYPDPDGKKGDLVAVRGNEPVGYKIPAAKAKPLHRPLLALRDHTVVDLVNLKPDTLTLDRGDAVTYTFDHKQGDQWSLQGADQFESDAFGQLRAMLSPLIAAKWVSAKGELPKADDADRRATLTIHPGKAEGRSEGAGKTRTLVVDPNTHRAQLTGVAGVFTVSAKLADRLTAEYRDRSLLPLTSDDIQRVEVTRGSKTRTLEAGEKGAARLFDKLTGFRVKRYLPAKPAKVGRPAVSFKIVSRAGKDFSLVLAAAKKKTDQPVVGRLGKRWFTVSARRAKALATAGQPGSAGARGPGAGRSPLRALGAGR